MASNAIVEVTDANFDADVLKSDTERWRVSQFGDHRLHVITDEGLQKAKEATTAKLHANGIRVLDVREARFSLEDVFISVVERARQQGKVATETEGIEV